MRDPYGNIANIITLTKAANLSTFLHESGHFWLHQLVTDAYDPRATPEARAALQADVQVVLDWMGLKTVGAGDSSADTILAAIGKDQHEQWARGVEAYLMEGKAPSASLRAVFARFSAWMVGIYKKIRHLDVKLTPEVRAVMDRLVATDDAIEAARKNSAFRVPSALASVLTAHERANLEKLAEQAAMEARADMQGRVAKELRREKTEWWKAERAKAEAEVTAEVRNRPAYRALNAMKGIGPDGNPLLGADGEPLVLKLDRRVLVEMYGAEIVRALPSGVTTIEGGLNPHVLAGMLGFTSADELRLALMSVKGQPMNRAIQVETDAAMKARHGDALSPAGLRDAALDVVNSDRQLQLMALQARYLRRLAGDAAHEAAAGTVADKGAASAAETRADTDTAERDALLAENAVVDAEQAASAQIGETMAQAAAEASVLQRRAQGAAVRTVRGLARDLNLDAVKAAAAWVMAGKTVREASPDRYRIQAARLGPKINAAIAGRKYDAAAAMMETQALNLALAKEAAGAKAGVEKALKRFRRLNRGDAKLASGVDVDFVKAARAVLSRFGLARPDRDFSVGDWLALVDLTEPGGSADLEAMINSLSAGAKPYQDLTIAEFNSLAEAVTTLLHNGRDARSTQRGEERVAFTAIIDEMRNQLAPRAKAPMTHRDPTGAERGMNRFLGAVAALKRVEFWARDLDDGRDGAFKKYIVRPVLEAVYAYRDAKRAKLAELLAILAPVKNELARAREIAAPELDFTFTSKGQLLHAVLHSGNDSNLKKLLVGRGWGKKTQGGGFDRSRWDAFMGRMFADGTLTQADMDQAQAVWDLLDSLKPAAQQAHRRMFGFYFSEVQARPVPTPWGDYRGGYVPAITDQDQVMDGEAQLDADAMGQGQNAAMFPATDRGFTKSRVDYNAPLMLDLTLLPGHLDKVLKFTHLGPVIRDTARLIKRADFGEVVSAVDKVAVGSLLVPWLQRTARQTVETPATSAAGRWADGVFRGLRLRAGLMAMAGNVLNAAQQVTGISSAAIRVPPAALMRSLVTAWRDPEASLEAISAKSAFMRSRLDHGAQEMGQAIDTLLKGDTVLGTAWKWTDRHGYFAQQFTQNLVDRVVWQAAYEQGVSSGRAEADAVYEADSVIRTTQGTFNPEDISAFDAGGTFTRLFTMFYSYFNTQANLIGTEARITLRELGWKGGGPKLFGIYIAGVLIPSLVAEAIVRAAKDDWPAGDDEDDEDDGMVDDLASLFVLPQLRTLAAMVPGVGQMATYGANLMNDKPYDDRMSTSPVASMLESAVRAPVSGFKAVFGDGSSQRAIRDGLNAIGMATGLPLGQLGKPLGYAADVAAGRADPEGPGDVIQGALSGRDGTRE